MSSVATATAIAAPLVNCVQLIPQLYKTFITRSVGDLSLYSLLLILVTNLLWFAHGLFIKDMSLLLSGFVSLLVNGTLLALYFLYA